MGIFSSKKEDVRRKRVKLKPVDFEKKWKEEWLRVVVPGCKASRFKGLAEHPRIHLNASYSLDYFLIGLMLDRWPKSLPKSWIKRLAQIRKDPPVPHEAGQTHPKLRPPKPYEKKIVDAYYGRRPSKAWLKANTAYIGSLPERDKTFLKAWGMTLFQFVNGQPLRAHCITYSGATLVSFAKEIPLLAANEEMVNLFEAFVQSQQTTFGKNSSIFQMLWESGEDYTELSVKREAQVEKIVKWLKPKSKLLREAMAGHLRKLTEASPPLDKEIDVYRGIATERRKDIKPRSFSLDYSVAQTFARVWGVNAGKETILGHLIRLTIPKGGKMLFLPTTVEQSNEMEAIVDMEQIDPRSWGKKWKLYLPSFFARCNAKVEGDNTNVVVFQGAKLK
jgi:hypothetical protein